MHVPVAIGEGRSPFAELDEPMKLDVVQQESFANGAYGQVLVPR